MSEGAEFQIVRRELSSAQGPSSRLVIGEIPSIPLRFGRVLLVGGWVMLLLTVTIALFLFGDPNLDLDPTTDFEYEVSDFLFVVPFMDIVLLGPGLFVLWLAPEVRQARPVSGKIMKGTFLAVFIVLLLSLLFLIPFVVDELSTPSSCGDFDLLCGPLVTFFVISTIIPALIGIMIIKSLWTWACRLDGWKLKLALTAFLIAFIMSHLTVHDKDIAIIILVGIPFLYAHFLSLFPIVRRIWSATASRRQVPRYSGEV